MLTCPDLECELRRHGVHFLSVHAPRTPGDPWRADARIDGRDWTIGGPQPSLAAAVFDVLRRTKPYDMRNENPLAGLLGDMEK